MRTLTHKLFIVLPLVMVPTVLLAAPAAAQQETASTVDGYVADTVATEIPGMSVALLHDDEIMHTTAGGTAGDGEPMSTDTPMRINSLSKSFTAAAVMQLVEAGEVELDQPVREHLPEFSIADERGNEITVRHLLAQTSGMTDATAPPLYDSGITTLEEAVERLEEATIAADPGSQFNYHNPNYHVLARMVEVVSGEEFGDYLDGHIFEPLGMESTQNTATAAETVPGMAQGHVVALGHALEGTGPDYFFSGSGGVVSTADDMAQWLWMHSNEGLGPTGDRILSAESVAQMHQPQGPDEYGFGWYHAESAEGPPVRTSHSGSGSGFNTYQGLFPDSGYAIVVLSNHGAELNVPQSGILAQNLIAEVDSDIPPLTAPDGSMPTDLVLAALAVLTLAAVVSGLLRARRWAERRLGRSVTVTVLRLVPLAVAIALVALVPQAQLMATGRTASWPILVTALPVGVAWLLTLAFGSTAVLVTRLVWLWLRSPRARSPQGDGT